MPFKKLATAIDNVARLARNIDWMRRLNPTAGGSQHPVADSLGAIASQQANLGVANTIDFGMVIDAIPSARTYRVQPDSGGPVLDCKYGTRCAVGPIGTYDADTLIPGTRVRFMRHKQETAGLILCADPAFSTDPRKHYGDSISVGSNCGLGPDSGAYEAAFALGGSQGNIALNGGITDWSGRTPGDSLEIGELNKSEETGLMLHLDSYMGFMRVNEWSGLWMFYWDGLVRLAGQNFQRWAGMSELEAYDDQGEHMHYHGIAGYPWEHMGQMVAPDAGATFEFTADEIQNSMPWYGRIEPEYNDMQPFHRFREYGGYLGQGQKKMQVAPDLYGATALLRYSDTDYEPVGLHEQNITMAGRFGMRSALGFTLCKRPIIPVPKRVEIVTSDTGDDHTDYKASSYYGAGADHEVGTAVPPALGWTDEDISFHMAAGVMDLHSHLFNWESLHPFYYHQYDYVVEEESTYSHVDDNQITPFWTQLDSASQWYLDTDPAPETITVDHRTGQTATVYQNTSYLTMLDEGGVLLGDGFGSEIRMVGGDIFITCPGDVFMEAGRNVVAWGGRDVCLRAFQSVDITACWDDVKIKAEKNVHVLAANNGGAYGVLIECRSTSTDYLNETDRTTTETMSGGPAVYDFTNVGQDVKANGIILRSPYTEIVGWARNIYLRTRPKYGKHNGVSETPGSQPKDWDIVLDTFGKGDIITRSEFVKHWVKCAVKHSFPDKPGIDAVNFFTEDGATLCGDVYTDGDLVSYGSHVCKGDFSTPEGHFMSASGGVVGKLNAGGISSLSDAIEQGHTYEQTLIAWSTTRWNIDLQQMWYSTGRPGNENIMKSAWFSLRVEEDYKSDSFFLYESRWAQLARLDGAGAPQIWTENAVESNKASGNYAPTYPFPGKQRMIEDYIYYEQDLILTTPGTGYESVDRGTAYEDMADATDTLETPTAQILDGTYPCIGKS